MAGNGQITAGGVLGVAPDHQALSMRIFPTDHRVSTCRDSSLDGGDRLNDMEKSVSFDPCFDRGLDRAKVDGLDLDAF
jgi:hypothetical protein